MRPIAGRYGGLALFFSGWAAAGVLLYFISGAVYPRETRQLPPGRDGAPVLVRATANARWLRVSAPLDLGTKKGATTGSFRRRFRLESSAGAAPLTIRSLGSVEASIDGRSFASAVGAVTIPPLGAGEHELVLRAINSAGPSLILAECPSLGLNTDLRWDASADGRSWSPAADAEADWDAPLAREFGSSAYAFLRELPWLALIFLGAFVLLKRGVPSPGAARAAVIAALAVLGLNNIRRIPVWTGFDAISHLRYVQFVAMNSRLPAPDSDWQAFQAPLYYLLSAPLWTAFSALFGIPMARVLVRVVPLACGVLHAELCFRAARRAFPGRDDLQSVATLTGGLLPMWLYMSQTAGNEPLAGCLSAAVVAAALSAQDKEPEPARARLLAAAGVCLGLALLAKVTAFLLIPPLLFLLWTRPERRSRRERLSDIGLVLAPATALCGWYYARNLVQYGRLFFLPSIDASWHQDPGYRTAGQMLSFGRALILPIYAGVAGFWDSLYSTLWLDGFLGGAADLASRPPWNYAPMLAGAPLALIPTALIGLGAASALAHPRRALRDGFLAAVAWPAVFVAAIFYGWLTLPIYGCAKASYMLGLGPCFALLAARGFGAVARGRAARAVAGAALFVWAAAAYCSYFVVSPSVLPRP